MLAGLVIHGGPGRLVAQRQTLESMLPLLLALTGARYVLQAAGWRLAIPPANRPEWLPFFGAVVVGEAVGYVAWGPIAREPAKALFLRPRVPARVALTAALDERGICVVAATALAVIAVGLLASPVWLAIGLAAAAVAAAVTKFRRRGWRPWGEASKHARGRLAPHLGIAYRLSNGKRVRRRVRSQMRLGTWEQLGNRTSQTPGKTRG